MNHVADRFVAVLDANVLYSSLKRNVLLSFAESGLYRPRWTDEIMDEWRTNLIAARPDLRERVGRLVEQMTRAFPEARIDGYEVLVEALVLPDAGDRHVLAAAVKCDAHVIVTENTKDFPERVLSSFDIELQSADEFLLSTFELYPGQGEAAVKRMRKRYKNPPYKAGELLTKLTGEGLVRLASVLRERVDTI